MALSNKGYRTALHLPRRGGSSVSDKGAGGGGVSIFAEAGNMDKKSVVVGTILVGSDSNDIF